MVYSEEKELIQRMRKADLKLKQLAWEMNMRPGTLSNKLRGWSYLYPDERRQLLKILEEKEKVQGEK